MSDVLSETLSEGFEWDPLRLEAAKSSLIFEKVEGLKAVPDVIAMALDEALNDLPQDFIK